MKLKMMIAMIGMIMGRPFGIRMKSCLDVARLLSDYVEGELSDAERRSIDLHVMACPDCFNYLGTFRATREIVGEIRYEEIPPEFRVRLHTVLTERLRGSQG